MVQTLTDLRSARGPFPAVAWLGRPAVPALQIASALDHVRRAPTILEGMRLRSELLRVTLAATADGVSASRLLDPIRDAIFDEFDTVTGLAAVHALALLPGTAVDKELADLLFDGAPGFEEHGAWAASHRSPTPWLIDTLSGTLTRGGIAGMHAQSALAHWAAAGGDVVLAALERRLASAGTEAARRHIIETIGLVPGSSASLCLVRVARDRREADSVRTTAIAAFTERSGARVPREILALAQESSPVGASVRTVRARRLLRQRGVRRHHDRSLGIKVAQVHLGSVLDDSMSQAGSGDTGGVATLLSRLGSHLAAQSRIAEVITIGRAADPASAVSSSSTGNHHFEHVSLEDGEGTTFTSTWPSLVAAQRGIRSALLANGVPDVMHLRMADPGSLAAALVAEDLRIPTVFTLAPDPHGPIADAEHRGTLDRRNFAPEDARGALWFRAELVARLASQARGVALFPRPGMSERLRDLVGIDIATGPPRYTVVPEGVDTHAADDAAEMVASGGEPSAVLNDLDAAIASLPAPRHGLPLVVTVGRMHEIKGMARVVAAFAADEALSERANLVIVGGELARPYPAEAAELARIEAILGETPKLADRVVLLGHRPNGDVSLLLAAAQAGWGERIASRGAYVCGSHKEEFGLAIVEAMAAGLPVVAPRNGGPATYVEPGLTGALVDTADPVHIATGLHAALTMASDAKTAIRTRAVVDDRYTLDRMARTLAAVYRVASGATTLSLSVGHAA